MTNDHSCEIEPLPVSVWQRAFATPWFPCVLDGQPEPPAGPRSDAWKPNVNAPRPNRPGASRATTTEARGLGPDYLIPEMCVSTDREDDFGRQAAKIILWAMQDCSEAGAGGRLNTWYPGLEP